MESDELCHDVTGGIKKKLQCAAEIVRECGVDVFVVQAGTSHAARVMSGDMNCSTSRDWVGTRISPTPTKVAT